MSGFQKKAVACVVIFAFLVCFMVGDADVASAATRSFRASRANTFRIKTETPHATSTTVGHGTAFAIDLSEYGLNRPRFLLTASHVVHDRFGAVCPILKIEVTRGPEVRWMRCRMLSCDKKLDVALLECETDLPQTARFATRDASLRSPIVMVGSPGGVPLRMFKGVVTHVNRTENSVARVEYIKEGCSGGPIFDGKSQRVVGLVVAGIATGKRESMDPHTCLFVSLTNLRRFTRVAVKSRGIRGSRPPYETRNRNLDPNRELYASPDSYSAYRTNAAGRREMWLP